MISERVDAITHVPEAWRSVTPPPPPSVKIELTARCDMSCFFCATRSGLRERGDIDWAFLERTLGALRQLGVAEIGLFYLGESLLYPRLAEVVDLAKRRLRFPYVFLTTNGRLATPQVLTTLFEAGLDSLKFSFNWADRAHALEITGIDCFDQVMDNLRAARAARDAVEARTGHRCGVWASSIRYDGTTAARMASTVETIRAAVDLHYWLPLYGQAGLTAGERGTRPVAGNVGRADNPRDPLPCWSLFTEGHVTWDGRLAACCFDHDGRFDMGDLTRTDFMTAWHSPAFQALRAASLARDVTGTACAHCIACQPVRA